jgi:AcrR family transcriptional regulator
MSDVANLEPVTSDSETDGRRRRAQDSRGRIVEAMLTLTQAGKIPVSAEMVAEQAGVGLRTVFRHFSDMDSLYREMSLTIETQFMKGLAEPLIAETWQARLRELIDRRITNFETITPFKRAETAYRHRSRFLQSDVQRMNTWLREALIGVLPEAITNDASRFEVLDLLLSFESWDRLRRDQALSPDQAREALKRAVETLLA